MSFFKQYYKMLSVFALIALHLQLSGCATYLVLSKTEPQEKIERYDSVYISPENDLILNLAVQIKMKQKEEIWCARLPLEDIVQNSYEVNQSIPSNSKASEEFYNTLHSISASHYTLIKAKCEYPDSFKIPIQYWGVGRVGDEVLFWEKNAPIKFISPRPHHRKMDYGYVTLKSKELGKIQVTKVALPLPPEVYNIGKLIFLPLAVALDAAMSPMYIYCATIGDCYMP